MRSIEEVNAEYTRLCSQVGEMTYRIQQLEEMRADNLRRIEVLANEARTLAKKDTKNGE